MKSLVKKKYLEILFYSICIYLITNIISLIFYMINNQTIESFIFDNGSFIINGDKVGNDFKSSIGFILLLFLALVYSNLKRVTKSKPS